MTLDDVSDHNLYIKYHVDGTTEMRRFPLCPYREDADEKPQWYDAVTAVKRT